LGCALHTKADYRQDIYVGLEARRLKIGMKQYDSGKRPRARRPGWRDSG
jgi:hypothetical protein